MLLTRGEAKVFEQPRALELRGVAKDLLNVAGDNLREALTTEETEVRAAVLKRRPMIGTTGTDEEGQRRRQNHQGLIETEDESLETAGEAGQGLFSALPSAEVC